MQLINIHQAKTHFSKLINAALAGEEIIIAKDGKPLITLTPYKKAESKRKGGQFKGMLEISSDFDKPLPPEILEKFYEDK